MTARNPRIGEKTVDGLLRAQGVVVQRQRVREALHTVDPQGSQRRMRRALNRREYHVECPNVLWHTDGTINSLGGALSFMEESMVTVDLFLTYMLLTIIAQKQHLIKHFKRELKRMVCVMF